MKKFWNIFGWVFTILIQIALCFIILGVLQTYVFPNQIARTGEFLRIPLLIWITFVVVVYGIGMLSLLIRKITPLKAGLRFFSSAGLALVPLGILIFLGLSVGVENQKDFQEIVLGRMVSYYANLSMVFSFLGFYIPNWIKFLQTKNKGNKTSQSRKQHSSKH